MGARSSGREAALQMLFALEAGGAGVEQVIASFWRETPGDPEGREYADAAVRGSAGELEAVDESIRKASTNWRIERMARVDRNVLRLAAYEMLYREDIPPIVSINEAVDIAKRFSTNDSGKFVNGILDSVKGELMRPARQVK